jgi:hypothetical protein
LGAPYSLGEVITIQAGTAAAAYTLDGSLVTAASVPDGGTTALLFGLGLSLLWLLRRKVARPICAHLLAVGLLVAAFSIRAHAASTISVYDGVNPLITVVDNGPGDFGPVFGAVIVVTNVGVWNSVIIQAETKRVFGSSLDPVMALNIQANSAAAGSLRVVFSDNNFGPASGTLTATVDGQVVAGAGAIVSYSVYGDPANVVGATTVLIASTGVTALPTSATVSGALALGAPFSLTQVLQIVASGATFLSITASDPPHFSPSTPTPVHIDSLRGTTLQYSGGSGTEFVLLKSTDMSKWERVATNSATPGAFTIPAVGTEAAAIYSIQSE